MSAEERRRLTYMLARLNEGRHKQPGRRIWSRIRKAWQRDVKDVIEGRKL